ncbi:RagB/SusD family nutrient uptake outer membrane protein [Labilibaculum sp. 44]|uniref:RagB/SusD family nutrient uptake outer membrane protein n=2 Tax=Labilibaculum euxinus TaxID=2686357 RepID=A0A7M4D6B4_9BACT|nr:RagB/SusD family nutrient uptake outer membrane protein [Labilibaculum euxinus]MVB07398.1 RagB/SusD family nutrient uptake outer membrane protein [Labilibaculum euxinus]
MTYTMKKLNIYIALLFAVVSFSACNDYLDVKPKDRVIPETADDFRALLTSAYNGVPADKMRLTFRTDELNLDNSAWDLSGVKDIYLWNDVNQSSNTLTFSYQFFYKVIMYANHIIDAGVNATDGTSKEIDQIVGEAYLLRALMHFNLVNQYGLPYNASTASTDQGIPISLKIDTEAEYFENTVEEVYAQIVLDIDAAMAKINVDRYGTGLNYRFSKLAALALKSRVYLYMGDFSTAKKVALEALAINSDLQDLVADASLAPHMYNSVESILALEVVFDSEIESASVVSDKLIGMYNQTNDLRFGLFFTDNGGGEFKPNKGTESDSKCSFRNAEMYLTIAECAAQTDDLDQARNYLNQLKAKRLLVDFYNTEVTRIAGLNKAELIAEIANERYREFAFEGHRWFDLRRTTQEQINHAYKTESATLNQGDPRYTLRYPDEAINNNPNLSN